MGIRRASLPMAEPTVPRPSTDGSVSTCPRSRLVGAVRHIECAAGVFPAEGSLGQDRRGTVRSALSSARCSPCSTVQSQRAAALRAGARLAVVFRAAVLRAAALRAGARLAVVFRAAVLRAAALRAGARLAVVFRAAVLRAAALRAGARLAALPPTFT